MNFLFLVAGCLTTFRLALLFSKETGPFRIFARWRRLPPPKSNAREGVSCLWCTAVYSSAIVTTGLYLLHMFPGREWPLWWLSFSAGAVILNQAFTKG